VPITSTTKTRGAWGDVCTMGGATYRRNETRTTVNSKSVYVDVESMTTGVYPVAYPDYTSWQCWRVVAVACVTQWLPAVGWRVSLWPAAVG
jgi:hypothetical protein